MPRLSVSWVSIKDDDGGCEFLRQQPVDHKSIRRISGAFFYYIFYTVYYPCLSVQSVFEILQAF